MGRRQARVWRLPRVMHVARTTPNSKTGPGTAVPRSPCSRAAWRSVLAVNLQAPLQLSHALRSPGGRPTPWQERFAQALLQAGLPFRAGAFRPFLDDIAAALRATWRLRQHPEQRAERTRHAAQVRQVAARFGGAYVHVQRCMVGGGELG